MKTRVIPEEVRRDIKRIGDEGWFVVVGDISEEALVSINYHLKRFGLEIVEGTTEEGGEISGDYWLRIERLERA